MRLSSPWEIYHKEVVALFQEDEEIKVTFDEESYELKLFVDNSRKADALAKLLPSEKTFGNVVVKISVVPSNDGKEETKASLIEEAFAGNPALRYIYNAQTPFGEFNYVVFESRVVQYFNDDMRDINGNKSTLYQELAKDIIGEETNLCFCTEAVAKDLQKPLGEWP